MDGFMKEPGTEGLVSVIIPVRNRPSLLVEAVESVLNQTWRSFEILIVDDGSTDETPSVAAEMAACNPGVIEVRRLEISAGPGLARNAGLNACRGEFVQFLDSDDLLRPGKLESQVRLLQKRPDCGVAYCRARREGGKGEAAVSHRTGETFSAILPGFLVARGWPTLAPLWRRTVCGQIGGFSDHVVLEDWLWDIRAGLLNTGVCYCPDELCVVRDFDIERASKGLSGLTAAQWAARFAVREEVARLLEGNGLGLHLEAGDFARSTFQMVRQCALAGHEEEASRGRALMNRLPASRAMALKIRAFEVLAALIGLEQAARLTEALWGVHQRTVRSVRRSHGQAEA